MTASRSFQRCSSCYFLSFPLLLLVVVVSHHTAWARKPSSSQTTSTIPPLSLQHGPAKTWTAKVQAAQALAHLEQQVEDYNAVWVASAKSAAQASSHRKLICLPLDERLFDPPVGHFSHEHVQTGDKMSLPICFYQAIKENLAEVPWLFTVSRGDNDHDHDRVPNVSPDLAAEPLLSVVGGPLDFRAPSNYVFLPWWMMRALGLRPRDVVHVQLTTKVPPGELVKLRPHSSEWSQEIAGPQAVLEMELRHYSALTKGSTIPFDYNGKRYWFDVVELRAAPNNEKQAMVKVQDTNIRTEFLVARDVLREKLRKKQQQQQQQEEAET